MVEVVGGGRRIHVLEYSSQAALESDAAKVSPDGHKIGLTSLDWISTPHFYKNARVIVIYLGCDVQIMRILEEAVGPQFAGGVPPPIVSSPCAP
jgi:hypothetical protein